MICTNCGREGHLAKDCKQPHGRTARVVLAIALASWLTPAAAQTTSSSIKPGDIFGMVVAAPGQRPGTFEAHPLIVLKDGSQCDVASLMCLARVRRDFGDEGLIRALHAIDSFVGGADK